LAGAPAAAMKAPETVEEANTWSSWALWAVANGIIDAHQARAIALLAKTFIEGLNRSEMKAEIGRLTKLVRAHNLDIVPVRRRA
jgi:hypothetical protein